MANARTITLANLLSDIRYQANVDGLTGRHPDARLVPIINRSIQRLRQQVSESGVTFYLYTKTGTFSTTEASDGPYAELAVPDDATNYPMGVAGIFGVNVKVNDRWYPLDRVHYTQEPDFQWNGFLRGERTGTPKAWFTRHVGIESTTTVSAVSLAILPVPDQAYSYALKVLPAWNDIAAANTTYVINGIAGWEEYVLWDAVVRITARDNDTLSLYQIARLERDAALQQIMKDAAGFDRGPLKRLDTRGRRLRPRLL